MFCKECGTKHPSYINYCPIDGQELASPLPFAMSNKGASFCAHCGDAVSASAQYCTSCGETQNSIQRGTTVKVESIPNSIKKFNLNASLAALLTPQMISAVLISLGIAILLTLTAALFLKAEVETAIIDSTGGEITRGQIHSLENYFSAEFQDEYEVNLDLPDIYNIFTYISFMHGVDFELTLAAEEEFSDFYEVGLEILAKNLTVPLLLIPFLLLIITGIVLGLLIKRSQLSFWSSITSFSLLYGLFLTISSFIANFSYTNNINSVYANVFLSFSGNFPLIESFVSGFILALAISGCTALLMVHGKHSLTYLKTKSVYLQYFSISTFVILVGFFAMVAITIGALISSPLYDEILLPSELLNVGLLGSLSIWVWDLAHFLPINFSAKIDGDSEYYTLHLLDSFSDNQAMLLGELFINESFPLWIRLSFLLPAILLIIVGYLLYNSHKTKLIEFIKFGISYGILILCMKLFTSLEFSLVATESSEFSETVSFLINTPWLIVFLVSAIYGTAFFAVGGFIKRFITE